ncbi:MAG TPA: GNAT family N-acetyltransferase [Acidimicrobiia bacterium]|nr:GNAT family N-acetyltransferase [Acidimicrobiia bacterium]
MGAPIRPATHADVEPIREWSSQTFSWGDYVPDRLPTWIEDPESEALVSVDDDDVPVAVAHVAMLSPSEGWLEGIRVRPDHRRSGRGSALNDALVEWATRRGARVVRLATEGDNEAARRQVETLGYRLVSTWVHGELIPAPAHRAPDQFRLRPAPGSDSEAAWLFWVASDLARDARELIALGWQWRTARPEDIGGAGEVLQSAAGWVMVDQPEPDWMRTLWMAATPDDILPLLDGLLDLAVERAVTEIDVKLPSLGWTAEALRRHGAEPEEMVVYSKAVG